MTSHNPISCSAKAVNRFVMLADDSDEVPDLAGDKRYADFKLTRKDWDHLARLHEVLQVRSLRLCPFVY